MSTLIHMKNLPYFTTSCRPTQYFPRQKSLPVNVLSEFGLVGIMNAIAQHCPAICYECGNGEPKITRLIYVCLFIKVMSRPLLDFLHLFRILTYNLVLYGEGGVTQIDLVQKRHKSEKIDIWSSALLRTFAQIRF